MAQDIERVLGDPQFSSEFRILSREGEGGMGLVFKAIQTSLNRAVAVKVLLPSLFADEDVARRLEREAQLTSELRKHENIVRLLTYGKVAGLPYVVYEFVEGESLSSVIEREAPLAIPHAVELVSQLLNGLSHAHKHRIIHRDIKPDNVLLDKFNNIKIMDFGIALGESAGERLTRQGVIIGTPAYMAPEQASGRGVSGQADLYAAGVILYEMLTGRLPWTQDSALAVLAEKVSGRFTPIEEVFGGLPEPLCKLIDRCLDPNPGARPQGAAAFRQELEAIASSMTGQLRPVEPLAKPAEATRTEPALTARVTQLAGPAPGTVAVQGPVVAPSHPRVPVELLVKGAAAAVVLAAITIATVWTSTRGGRGRDLGIESASGHFLASGDAEVTWPHPEDIGAQVEVSPADGEGEAVRVKMERTGPGMSSAVIKGLDRFRNYTFKIVIPSLVGISQASKPRPLDGAGALVDQLCSQTAALAAVTLLNRTLAERRKGIDPDKVAPNVASALYDVTSAASRLEPLAPVLWEGEHLSPEVRTRLADALESLLELKWRLEALDVKVALEPGKLLPREMAPPGSPIRSASSGCRLIASPVSLGAGTKVELSLGRCSGPEGKRAQILFDLTGRAARPLVLRLAVGGGLSLRLHASGEAALLSQELPTWRVPSELPRKLTLEALPIELVTTVGEAPGLTLTAATLKWQ